MQMKSIFSGSILVRIYTVRVCTGQDLYQSGSIPAYRAIYQNFTNSKSDLNDDISDLHSQ